jgi:glycine cleavage system H lipoate-binding protein/ABC-type phosphate transport system substrate-binding protein
MNPLKTITIVMVMLFISMTAIHGAQEEQGAQEKKELKVICSPELENLAQQVAGDYMKENEGLQIQLSFLGDHRDPGNLPEGSMALVNKVSVSEMNGEQNMTIVVGRDAIVPIMNASNPNKEYILKNGISPEKFAMIYTSGNKVSWGEVLGIPDANLVSAYAPGSDCALNYLADFLQIEEGRLKGFEAMGAEQMMKVIASDPAAIGFCSLACLMNMEITMENGIGLVPVDMDGSGQIEEFENIYKSASMLSHAIFVGRFPRSLYSRIYAVSPGPAAEEGELAFLEWILGDGQESLARAGIMELGYSERSAGLEQLSGSDQTFVSVPVKASTARIYLIMGAFFLLLGVLIYVLATMAGRRSQAPVLSGPKGDSAAAFPGGLFFDTSHTWAFMEKNGRVRIGIDDFLQKVCGPVTRVLMKKPGEQIRKGEHFLTLIQNGKRLEIKSPVSGIIEEQNEGLIKDASLLNNEPYAAGWVLMVKPQNWIAELKSYFIGQAYSDWLKTEADRLKEFFTNALKFQETVDTAPVMQDGGEIRGGVMEAFGPELWEEFQHGFINNTK